LFNERERHDAAKDEQPDCLVTDAKSERCIFHRRTAGAQFGGAGIFRQSRDQSERAGEIGILKRAHKFGRGLGLPLQTKLTNLHNPKNDGGDYGRK
jgi:hypothetical protein